MEANLEEALKAKEIAEKRFVEKDFAGAKNYALKAKSLYPALEGISQMVTTFEVYTASEAKCNGEVDYYSILGLKPFSDKDAVKKQYRKMAVLLHPDNKNKCVGADGAFRLVSRAWTLLSDSTKTSSYDMKRNKQSSSGVNQINLSSVHATGVTGFNNGSNSSNSQGRLDTFWTVCTSCKVQYEYLRKYVNKRLSCKNCRGIFIAVETGTAPANGSFPYYPWSHVPGNGYGSHGFDGVTYIPATCHHFSEFLPEPFAEEGIEKQITSESQGMVFDVETVEMKSSGEKIGVEFEASGQDKKFEIEDIGIGRPETSDIDRNTFSIIQGEAHQLCRMWGGLGLTEMPKEEDWKNVKEICLMHNELSSLPENPRCPMLLALFLQGNHKLRTIPPSFFDNMPTLQILNLSRTGIRSLPESIVRLVNLKRLFLSYCHRFMRLSPKVGELKQLEVLDLEGTDIMDLPKEIKELTNLTCLEVSFCAYLSNVRRAMQSDVVVPCGIFSALSHLEELNMSVNPDDKRWSACVEAIVTEVCTLQSLNTLKFYFPRVELVRLFLLNSPMWVHPSLSNFIFTVGHHVQRTVSRLPRDVEFELERWERCLKYINGVAVPEEIKKVLHYSTAFLLKRHASVKKLSDFGIGNMKHLKCCVVGECNEVEVIIDATDAHEDDSEADAQEENDEANAHEGDGETDAHEEDSEADEEDNEADAHEEDDEEEAYREDGSSGIVSKTSGAKKIVLGSLEYLYIYYMKNLRRIWKGPIQPKCLSLLKSLTLRTCPQLTIIFTRCLLDNLCNLEELTVEDCPSIKTLVSCKISAEPKTSDFLPNLKRISLHYMPGLISISSGLHIAPRLECLSFYNCPNLKHLLIEEVSSKDLKKIKGEWNWWVALKWRCGRPSYLDDIFVPINI